MDLSQDVALDQPAHQLHYVSVEERKDNQELTVEAAAGDELVFVFSYQPNETDTWLPTGATFDRLTDSLSRKVVRNSDHERIREYWYCVAQGQVDSDLVFQKRDLSQFPDVDDLWSVDDSLPTVRFRLRSVVIEPEGAAIA